jgi:hypothetical protein
VLLACAGLVHEQVSFLNNTLCTRQQPDPACHHNTALVTASPSVTCWHDSQLLPPSTATADASAGDYSGYFSPFRNITGNYENLQTVAYTYKDPVYLQAAAHTDLPVSSSSSSADTVPAADAGSEVGSPAAISAVQRQLAAWSGGYNGYTWQLHLRQFEKALPGLNQTVEVLVFMNGVPGAEPFPISSSSGSGGKISPNSLRLRKDFCGAVTSWNDGAAMLAGKRFRQAVDLTACMQAAGIGPDVPPADASNAGLGPVEAPIRVSDLRFVVLTASGEDVTAFFTLGKPVIGWALAVDSQQPVVQGLASTHGVSASEVAAAGDGVYSLHQGFFD